MYPPQVPTSNSASYSLNSVWVGTSKLPIASMRVKGSAADGTDRASLIMATSRNILVCFWGGSGENIDSKRRFRPTQVFKKITKL